MAGGDRALERRFITIFLGETAKTLDELSRYCVDGDCAPWSEAAHKLKGAAANMGAEKLRRLSAAAQDMRHAQGPARREMLAAIGAALEEVRKEIAAAT